MPAGTLPANLRVPVILAAISSTMLRVQLLFENVKQRLEGAPI